MTSGPRPFRSPDAAGILALLAAFAVSACGSRRGPDSAQPVPVAVESLPSSIDGCAIPAGGAGGPVIIGLGRTETVDPSRAPVPANATERLLFRQLYETLVRVDCGGQVRPALAERWSSDSSGLVWTLALRDAAFADGTRVTPKAVRDGWARQAGALGWPSPQVASVDVGPDQELIVTLTEPSRGEPAWLADPVLAVGGVVDGSVRSPSENELRTQWPSATGLYQADSSGAVRPRDAAGRLPTIVLRGRPGDDPRDLLDDGTDLLITRDPAAGQYAARHADFLSIALPWDQTYVFVSPAGFGGTTAADTTESVAFRQALWGDAVHADARAAEPPFWWQTARRCEATSSAAAAARGRRVVYARDDPTARGLAERIVALTETASQSPLAAVGLEENALAASLASGVEAGWVLALPRRPPASCRDLPAWPHGSTLLPLVDTRPVLIIRRGVAPLIIDGDGTPRVAPPDGREDSPAP